MIKTFEDEEACDKEPRSPDSSPDTAEEQLDEIELNGFQFVRTEFFAHIHEPSFTFNDGKVGVNTACVRKLPDHEYIQILINKDTRIQMNFIRLLSSTVHNLGKKLKILALYTIREKMADFILDEARRRNNNSFILSMSRQDIADMFAVQRFSVQRVLREFNEEGIIRLNGKYVTILDKEKLEALNAI